MGNGINLGNTMEAYNHNAYLTGGDPSTFETVWGQPVTTQKMIDDMKALGFDTLRVPVAWTNGMNFESGDYTIDERLMKRVEEIVNYALNADMYVIINDHWDGGWWGMFGNADMAMREKAMEMYKSMWTQIGEHFKDYSYKLIFESANEELGDRLNDKDIAGSKGTLSAKECYEKTYEINTEFVKVIRGLGGKNADRFLLIAGYNTDIQRTCDDRYKMPEDTAKDKLILSVHYYTPWDYCGTDAIEQWGSVGDLDEMNSLLKSLTKFTDKGYGVIIGEYAVMKSNGGIKPDTDKFYTNFLDNCDLYNYVPVLWDCSNLYKRHLETVSDEKIADIFRNRSAAKEVGVDYETIKANAQKAIDELYQKAKEEMMDEDFIEPADDKAVAWIMYQSSDWGIAYSVGDKYDPTNMSTGVKAKNALITGAGTYTISLDLSAAGKAKGFAFSAIGISNGETLFPGYIITIDEILINGEKYTPEGKNYTSSDDGKCTRSNLYNQWVPAPPSDARIVGGDLSEATPKLIDIGNQEIKTLEITFTYSAP
ncbi:MAG: glycoside hydrolase family 5 protein [Ruminiclostridium sp.]|nr:glycoside hydrolase family 5 protein [Ruminiclostridium sp.]